MKIYRYILLLLCTLLISCVADEENREEYVYVTLYNNSSQVLNYKVNDSGFEQLKSDHNIPLYRKKSLSLRYYGNYIPENSINYEIVPGKMDDSYKFSLSIEDLYINLLLVNNTDKEITTIYSHSNKNRTLLTSNLAPGDIETITNLVASDMLIETIFEDGTRHYSVIEDPEASTTVIRRILFDICYQFDILSNSVDDTFISFHWGNRFSNNLSSDDLITIPPNGSTSAWISYIDDRDVYFTATSKFCKTYQTSEMNNMEPTVNNYTVHDDCYSIKLLNLSSSTCYISYLNNGEVLENATIHSSSYTIDYVIPSQIDLLTLQSNENSFELETSYLDISNEYEIRIYDGSFEIINLSEKEIN